VYGGLAKCELQDGIPANAPLEQDRAIATIVTAGSLANSERDLSITEDWFPLDEEAWEQYKGCAQRPRSRQRAAGGNEIQDPLALINRKRRDPAIPP